MKAATVKIEWDSADGWVATSKDILGLVLSSFDRTRIIDGVRAVGKQLLEANIGPDHGFDHITFRWTDECCYPLET